MIQFWRTGSIADFNPLPPRGGRRLLNTIIGEQNKFQSTPSAWRETQDGKGGRKTGANFNPLPPRGGRPPAALTADIRNQISIHSLRVEGDVLALAAIRMAIKNFNPLPPRGGRHICEEQDALRQHFNPLPPRGGRLERIDNCKTCLLQFQSTPSAWRETELYLQQEVGVQFQSTPSAWRETYSIVHF